MASYLLRDVDPSLWERFKARAANEGRSIRWILLQLIKRYVDQGLD